MWISRAIWPSRSPSSKRGRMASETISGGCHCKAVRYRAKIDVPAELLICNCSICSASGYEHLFVPEDDFELISGQDSLTSYRFGSGEAEHLFCKICGVKSYYYPRSHPGSVSVHVQCLDEPVQGPVTRTPFDGRNWDAAKQALDQG